MDRTSAAKTYLLEDLENWDFPGTSLAVLGMPVRHSISPQMHNAALAELEASEPQLSDWCYFRFEIAPEDLVSALPLFHAKGFLGLNLTVPHKEVAFPAVVEIDPAARPIGAVNTLVKRETGYAGFNTDGYGLAQGVQRTLQRPLADSDIVLLGAGGAARAAAIEALASNCRSLTIVNRNQDRLGTLIAELQPIAARAAIPLAGQEPQASDPLPAGCLLINATSLGLKGSDPMPIPLERLPDEADCFDMIYNPTETALLTEVARRGGRTGNGLTMLVYQGARSLEIWTGKTAPAQTMHDAANAALATH